jgi:hypothetical protein
VQRRRGRHGRHPSRRRDELSASRPRLRLVVPVLVTVSLVVGGSLNGLAGIRTDARHVAVRGALDEVRAQIDLVHGVLDGLQGRVRMIEADLGALRDIAAAADVRLRAYERALDKRRAQATEVVTTGRLPGRPLVPVTLADLRAPLLAVNRAVFANDQLAIELVGQQGDAERRVTEARQMLASLRHASFQLVTQERTVRAELTQAIRAADLLGRASGDPDMEAEAIALVERARGEVHRIDVARTELRSEELEVLEASIALEDRVSSVRSGLRRARLARQELYADMELAELLVASQLTSWRGPDLGDVSIALDGVLRVCPVDEPMTYTDNWHAPRWGGGFHLHQGIDIFAPTGTAIRAPFDGIAVVADNWLGGLAVKVYGDGGYVYNAHLSAHGMLGQVEAGDIIGFVGSTGNASGPHDHFEYHPGNGEAVNPFPFLNAVC